MTLLDADIPGAMTVRARCRMDAGVIVLAVVAALSTQIEAGSPVRAAVVLAALVLVPGWAVVSLFSSGPPGAMLGMAIGLSLAIDVLASLVLVWTGHFTDGLILAGVLGTGAVLLLSRDVARQARSSRAEISAPPAAG